MAFTFKDIVKNPLTIVSPATGLLDSGLDGKISNFLFGKKGGPGPTNPFQPPDFKNLEDVSKFDFVKNGQNLTQGFQGFENFLNLPGIQSDPLFQDYLGSIEGSSALNSIDSVRGELESDVLQQLLGDIDLDTNAALADTKLDALDRGIGSDSQFSDIEANALARVRGEGAKRKASARSGLMLSGLDRLERRESERNRARQGAFGQRYQAGTNRDSQLTNLFGQGALSDQQLFQQLLNLDASDQRMRDLSYADILQQRDIAPLGIQATLYNQGEQRRIDGRKPRTPGLFDRLLNKGTDKLIDRGTDAAFTAFTGGF